MSAIADYAAAQMRDRAQREAEFVTTLLNVCRTARRYGQSRIAGIAAEYEMQFEARLEAIGLPAAVHGHAPVRVRRRVGRPRKRPPVSDPTPTPAEVAP